MMMMMMIMMMSPFNRRHSTAVLSIIGGEAYEARGWCILRIYGPKARYGACLPKMFAVKCCQTSSRCFLCVSKFTKIDFGRGVASDSIGGAYNCSLKPFSWWRGG